MAIRKLGSIYARFYYRTDQIAEIFRTPLPSNSQESQSCQPMHQAGEVQLINRLLVLWGEYCWNLVIISALGDALTIQGTLLSPSTGVRGFSDIRAKLGVNFGAGPRTKWDEPQWALQCANALSPTNMNQIGLGLTGVSVDSLKSVRNFLVHPNERTRNIYQNLAQALGYHGIGPKTLLNSNLGMGSTVLESWIADFQNAARNSAL